MKRIFGPVPSRRLGISLGIDVVPYKTCTFDCVYCECGATTDLRVERGEFFVLDGYHCRYCEYSGVCRKSHGPTRYRSESDPRVALLRGLGDKQPVKNR